MHAEGWCLVLALWGEGYGVAEVNRLARDARALGPGCRGIVLFSDRPRDGLDPGITARRFPPFFARPECFGWGYVAKLAVFSRADLPARMRCIYLDLDSVITGDLGRLAALVERPGDIFMLPPGNPVGFGRLRRLIFRMTRGRRYAVGNSSIMAWSSATEPDLAERYRALHAEVGAEPRHMQIDDLFISWAAQGRLRGIPRTLGVSFRREFLSRLGGGDLGAPGAAACAAAAGGHRRGHLQRAWSEAGTAGRAAGGRADRRWARPDRHLERGRSGAAAGADADTGGAAGNGVMAQRPRRATSAWTVVPSTAPMPAPMALASMSAADRSRPTSGCRSSIAAP